MTGIKRGRPRGSTSTCGFCFESGHNARGGSCSGSALAEREIAESGCNATEAARLVGISPQAVSQRKIRQRRRAEMDLDMAGGLPYTGRPRAKENR